MPRRQNTSVRDYSGRLKKVVWKRYVRIFMKSTCEGLMMERFNDAIVESSVSIKC